MKERWKELPGHEGRYKVSDRGRVRGPSGRILRQQKHGNGYTHITLCEVGGRQSTPPTHQLVLFAFVGPRPPEMECCHNNGKRWDNRLSNLRYDTLPANRKDAYDHGFRGEGHSRSKLTERAVKEIRRRHARGESYASLARDFGVSRMTVTDAVVGHTWRHIPLLKEVA